MTKLATMLDIETLGVLPGSVILQLAALQFDEDTGEVLATFDRKLDRRSQLAAGLVVYESTVEFWKTQPKEVRERVGAGTDDTKQSLLDFARFLPKAKESPVYVQGASFDFPLLKALYGAFDMGEPWRFWNERDTRTVYAEYGLDYKEARKVYDRDHTGASHDGVYDCQAQIALLLQARARRTIAEE